MKRMAALLLVVLLIAAATTGCKNKKDNETTSQEILTFSDYVPESEAAASIDFSSKAVSSVASQAPVSSSGGADRAAVNGAFASYLGARAKSRELTLYEFEQNILVMLDTSQPDVDVDLEKTQILASGGTSVTQPDKSAYNYSRISAFKDEHRNSTGSSEAYAYGDGSIVYSRNKYIDNVNSNNNSANDQTATFEPAALSKWVEEPFSYQASHIKNYTLTQTGGNQYYKFTLDANQAAGVVRDAFQSIQPDSRITSVSVSYFVVTVVIDSKGYLITEDVSVICRITASGVTQDYELKSTADLKSYGQSTVIQVPAWLSGPANTSPPRI